MADEATAEDLLQEVLVAAVVQPPTGVDAPLRPWLFATMRHKIYDHYRWKRRHPADAQPQAPTEHEHDGQVFDADGLWRSNPNQGLGRLGHADAVERRQLRQDLQRCLDHLPERVRDVFVLRELDELEPDEVAELLGLARQSVAVFLYRARQHLRTCLQQHWGAS